MFVLLSSPKFCSNTDEDFRHVDNRSFTYEIYIGPDEQSVSLAAIEILNDLDIEGDETFTITLTLGDIPNVAIDMERMVATVTINDDGKCNNNNYFVLSKMTFVK